MKTGKRNHDLRRIKRNMTYSVEDVSALLGCHVQTVRRWISGGLPLLDSRRPFLIHGYDLLVFLKKEQNSRRHTCKDNELYCFKCRAPRRAAANMADLVAINQKTARMMALCAVCSSVMGKVVSLKKVDQIRQIFLTGQQGQEHITDSRLPSARTHLGEGDEHD